MLAADSVGWAAVTIDVVGATDATCAATDEATDATIVAANVIVFG